MSEEVKPVVPATEPVVEPTPAPEVKAEEPVTAPETAPEAAETKPVETTEEAAKEEETVPAKEAKPVYEGSLGYSKLPVVGSFIQQKYHFFFGDEAVPAEKLDSAVKAAKKEYAHAVAWSNETGKGLLFYVKEATKKDTPAGVIPLSEVEDVAPKGKNGITFKLHTIVHNLKAATPTDRDGWIAAFHEKIAEAKAMKDDIVGKDSYKETHEKYSKPAFLAAGAGAAGAAGAGAALPKKSFEDRKARSKTTDKERKDRSLSRGKKLFGLGGKKEEAAKAEEEVKPEGEAAAVEPVVPETEAAKPEAEAVSAAGLAEPIAPVEETKEASAVKKERRGSKFLDYLRNATSPTREKKLDETLPAAPETAVAETAPVIPDTIKTEEAAPEVAAAPEAAETEAAKTVEETPAEASATAGKKESRRTSFFGALGGKKAKATDKPAAEDAVKPAGETAAVEEVAKPAEVEGEAAAVTEPAAITEPSTAETAAARTKKENPLVSLARRASTAIRSNKKTKAPTSPATEEVKEAEEVAKPAEEIPATSAEPGKTAEVTKPAEEAATEIPEPAVTSTNPTVTATA